MASKLPLANCDLHKPPKNRVGAAWFFNMCCTRASRHSSSNREQAVIATYICAGTARPQARSVRIPPKNTAPKLGRYFSSICDDEGVTRKYVICYGGDDEFPVRGKYCGVRSTLFTFFL